MSDYLHGWAATGGQRHFLVQVEVSLVCFLPNCQQEGELWKQKTTKSSLKGHKYNI